MTTSSIRRIAVAASTAILCCAYVWLATARAEPAATSTRAAPAATTPPVIDIMASDYSFDAPDTLPAGLVTVRLMNHGQEVHHAQLLRLNDGVSFEDFGAALQTEGDAALRLVTLTGGPGAVNPSNATEVTLNLSPGAYALACFVASADGVPHLAKGMLKPISVVAGETQSTEAPNVAGTLSMRDFVFQIPDVVPAGHVTYNVVNDGPQPHELNILRLAPGATPLDVISWQPDAGTPPPFEAVGGMNGLSQGQSDYMSLDLEPGTYVAICNIPDPGTGLPHARLGMIRQFTVQ